MLCVAAPSASAWNPRQPMPKWITMTSSDGVRLRGIVFLPPGMKPGDRPPGIAFAAAWNGGAEQNSVPAYQLARRGYVVISYTTRGTGKDGDGKVNRVAPIALVSKDKSDTANGRFRFDAADVFLASVGASSTATIPCGGSS